MMVGLAAVNIMGQQTAAGVVPSSDDEAAKKVDAFLSQWDKNDMPGGAVGVVKDGRLVYKIPNNGVMILTNEFETGIIDQ